MTGYFGKVPAHGDFVSRRLPDDLVAAWDAWLQACIADSRARLGAGWLDHYLTSPVWRFGIAPGVLGADGMGGVMMPSVDRAGRYFPLMIGAPGARPLLDWFQQHGDWFDEIEDLARASLDPAFRLEAFDAAHEPGPLLGHVVLPGRSLWWTMGEAGIEGTPLICAGMPPTHMFTAMLDGSWLASGRSA